MIPPWVGYINRAIAELIATDVGNQAYIDKLEGARIQVLCLSPQSDWLIDIKDGALVVTPQLIAAADSTTADSNQSQCELDQTKASDLILKGRLLGLLKLLGSDMNDANALRNAEIEISGDVGLLMVISQVAKNIEIDGQELLSGYVGEAPAMVFQQAFSAMQRSVKAASSKVGSSIKEHFDNAGTEPPAVLPTQADLKQISTEIRQMTYRLDRLEAAMKQKTEN